MGLDCLAVWADNHEVSDRAAVQVHPHWVQAEAAVQAEIDRDVLDEAAGLAEAELSQVALLDLIYDSVGAFIHIHMVAGKSHGIAAGILCGALRGNLEGATLHWLVLDECHAISSDSLIAVRGLKRFAAPLTVSQVSRDSGLHAWLRNRIGLRVTVHIGSYVSVGILSEVGADFLSVYRECAAELILLSAIDSLEIS